MKTNKQQIANILYSHIKQMQGLCYVSQNDIPDIADEIIRLFESQSEQSKPDTSQDSLRKGNHFNQKQPTCNNCKRNINGDCILFFKRVNSTMSCNCFEYADTSQVEIAEKFPDTSKNAINYNYPKPSQVEQPKEVEGSKTVKEILEKHLPKRYYGHEARSNAKRAMEEYASQLPAIDLRGERFKKPTDKQYVEIALLFNDGKIQKSKLRDMIAMAEFIIDRLYKNGDVSKKSSKE